MNRALFSSASVEWETPAEFFDVLDEEFHFTVDVCALPDNAKCARFYTPEDDGLSMPWNGVVWCNPPYGRAISLWIQRAVLAADGGGNGSNAASCKNRHELVSRFRLQARRDQISAGPIEIWRSKKQRAVPVDARYI